ncbi:hypothetical protein ABFA07_020908 [Porites harrisoni]
MTLKLQIFLLFLIKTLRYTSAIRCDVTLPQKSTPDCKIVRKAALAENKKTWTLKHDPDVYGFARLNMTPAQLAAIVFKDPFTRHYTTAYTQTLKTNEKVLTQYINQTSGQPINDFSEYLAMSEFFQTVLEPLVGEYATLASRHEAFINDKTKWISDKYFTQQRLAGTNPMSLQRVTVHGRGDLGVLRGRLGRHCKVITIDGRCCRFPFKYWFKTYKTCIKDYHHRPRCPTYGGYPRWGICKVPEKPAKPALVGLDWSKLKETLNPNFDWDAAVQAVLSRRYTLKKAVDQGRIYALRYELCDGLARSPDLTDKDPQREMWNFFSPIALFASKPISWGKSELLPVAIQMDFKPDSAVYTPNDGDNWMMAKLNVQVTDIGYAQIVEHLGRVHFMVEPFCVILKRTLSKQHPLNQILRFHCRELTVPNTFGVPNLVNENGLTDKLFAYGNKGSFRMLKDTYPLSTWEITDYRGNIKKRGLNDRRLLPFFPFRDDGYIILEVIEQMVKDYVTMYYEDDKDVKEDTELQDYVNELSLDGTGPNGGIGRIQGFPKSIGTKRELCEILSRFLSHVTIYHAAVNYVVVDYGQYIPNQPTKLYNDSRVEVGEFSVYRLPNRLTTAIHSSAFNTLGIFRLDRLFDYGNLLEDTDAVNLINRYYSKLMHFVQPKLQNLNQKRKARGDLTYPYFIPKWLPNGIQT